ncbi:MAG TPA: TetR/AcrR family transcriptional regulator C-terminal domain-containing protein, partial [Actinospica sp.]|nr:TetR/AcrR family transcriptional regulator C-terminal domain-containing protein [Actinospica sp.]
PSGDARADLLAFAKEGLEAMRRHPWVPALVLTRPTIGPNSLRCTEYFLAVMAGSEQAADTKMELFAMLNSSICMYAQWEANQRQAGGGEQWQTELVTYLAQAAATGEYPHLAATFAASTGPAPDLDPDVFFARAMDRVISIVLAA